MQKEVFNQIIVDNIDATLVSVVLSNGMVLSRKLEIEGNRTTSTNVTFIKIEETYVGVREKLDVTYDYSGQTRKGDSKYADYYMAYEDIVALEFYEESVKKALEENEKAQTRQASLPNEVEREYVEKSQKKSVEEELFIKTAGDI